MERTSGNYKADEWQIFPTWKVVFNHEVIDSKFDGDRGIHAVFRTAQVTIEVSSPKAAPKVGLSRYILAFSISFGTRSIQDRPRCENRPRQRYDIGKATSNKLLSTDSSYQHV